MIVETCEITDAGTVLGKSLLSTTTTLTDETVMCNGVYETDVGTTEIGTTTGDGGKVDGKLEITFKATTDETAIYNDDETLCGTAWLLTTTNGTDEIVTWMLTT